MSSEWSSRTVLLEFKGKPQGRLTVDFSSCQEEGGMKKRKQEGETGLPVAMVAISISCPASSYMVKSNVASDKEKAQSGRESMIRL